jgi:hypothetical protein
MKIVSNNQDSGVVVDNNSEPVHRDLVRVFVGKQATVEKSGIIFPTELSERSWEKIGSSLRELTNSSAWWLADWLIFGEATYGWRRYREAIERTGLDYQTLRNYAWVARRFEHGRRHDTLSFAHHAEVARMAPPEQDYWLRKAEQQKWSRNELRRAVRASVAEQNNQADITPSITKKKRAVALAEQPGADAQQRALTTLTIELSPYQLDYYSKLAASHGLSLDKWVTQVLDTVERRSA